MSKKFFEDEYELIFSRLQRGKSLNSGERLNAMPGEVVNVIREIAKHPFIAETVDIKDDRYEKFPDVPDYKNPL